MSNHLALDISTSAFIFVSESFGHFEVLRRLILESYDAQEKHLRRAGWPWQDGL